MNLEEHKGWYREMLRIRLAEEEIARRYEEQQMRCPVHLCIGQEAIPVGVCAHLTRRDYVFGNHRSHGHYLAKGGGLTALVAELYGRASGCCGGIGGSMHLVDIAAGFMGATPVVASTIPIAVGAAFGSVMKGEDRVVTVFFGDAAVEEGVFHEAANFAALKKLPVIFVCENNLYSVYSPLAVRQPPGREIFRLAEALGISSSQGDGNDVAEVARMTSDAVRRARRGEGPSFLEFKTYRWREHVGPYYDNTLGYRQESEFLDWKKRDPIESCQRALMAEGALSARDTDVMIKEISAEIERAFTDALRSPFPDKDLPLATLVYSFKSNGSGG